MHQTIAQDVRSLKYITNHDKVCLSTAKANVTGWN